MANDWLKNLKVGDEVLIGQAGVPDFTTKVKRFTRTLIITEQDGRYRRFDGRSSSRISTHCLREPTQERLEKLQHRLWSVKLRHHKWQDESLCTLAKIVQLLKDGKT